MRTIKIVAISIALVFIQACSHPIEIVGQGDVTSASGNRNCYLRGFPGSKDQLHQELRSRGVPRNVLRYASRRVEV